MPMKLDFNVQTAVKGIMNDEADAHLDGVTFVKETYNDEYIATAADPLTRYLHDNVYLTPGQSRTWDPGFIVEYVMVVLRLTAAVSVTQEQGAYPVTQTVETKTLTLRGTFTSIAIEAINLTNVTDGKIIMVGRDA